jgi:hypothetical protein
MGLSDFAQLFFKLGIDGGQQIMKLPMPAPPISAGILDTSWNKKKIFISRSGNS